MLFSLIFASFNERLNIELYEGIRDDLWNDNCKSVLVSLTEQPHKASIRAVGQAM